MPLPDFIDLFADLDRFGRAEALFMKERTIGAPLASPQTIDDLPLECADVCTSCVSSTSWSALGRACRIQARIELACAGYDESYCPGFTAAAPSEHL